MSTHESVDVKQTYILGSKIRDGRFGPVFIGLENDTGNMVTMEKLILEEPDASSVTTDRVMSHLETKQVHQSQPNVVSYLGYQRKEGHIFVLTEHVPGGTLRDFVQQKGPVPKPLARSILRQIVLGLEQLQTQGFAVVFLDSTNIFLDNMCRVKIEAPLLDITFTGQPLPSTILTLPELILGQQNIRKADVWLFGIIAAQVLTGRCNIGEASEASTVAAQIKQGQGSAWELALPQSVVSEFDEQASDLIRRCLTFDINQRASISDLKEHPFLSLEK